MTFHSLYAYECSEPLSIAELKGPTLSCPVFEKLAPCARDCSPFQLADWAKIRGLTVHYVDPCWSRVIVSAAELRAFYSEVLRLDPVDERPMRVLDGITYLMEAEEF